MLVLDTRGYDIIIGMFWLSKYHAIIDCRNKKIIFKIPHQAVFQFDGEYRYATRKTQIVTTEVQKKGVPVWNKFPDVFEEISGLPLDRAVEFFIDTILGTFSISKAPYRMAPTELEILKKQYKNTLIRD